MKRQLLLGFTFLLSGLSYAQMGQLSNGGFENWTVETLADTLVDWRDSNSDQQGPPTVFRSTDAADGDYSAEISAVVVGPAGNQDTLFGYIFQGTVGNNGPEGGIPYTSTFDEVQYQYKADLVAGDTLNILMIRLNSGIPGGLELYPAAYGTVNTWTQGSISVNAGMQDELFIGFVMGNPFGNAAPNPNSSAWVDNIRMFNSGTETTALPDPSLENWNSVTTEIPDDWNTLNPLLSQSGLSENVVKTTDAASGSFAAEMTVILEPQGQDTIGAVVSLGQIDLNMMNPFIPAPYEAMPVDLTGSYKYAPANLDASAGLLLEFYQGGTQVYADYQAFTANASYTNFTLPITLVDSPDSVLLYAYAGDNPGSVLHLDDLSFNGGDVGTDEFSITEAGVYPNPSNDIIHLRADAKTHYTIIDIMGKEVRSGVTEGAVTKFNLADLKTGIYFFKLFRNGTEQTIKFVKK